MWGSLWRTRGLGLLVEGRDDRVLRVFQLLFEDARGYTSVNIPPDLLSTGHRHRTPGLCLLSKDLGEWLATRGHPALGAIHNSKPFLAVCGTLVPRPFPGTTAAAARPAARIPRGGIVISRAIKLGSAHHRPATRHTTMLDPLAFRFGFGSSSRPDRSAAYRRLPSLNFQVSVIVV